MKMRWLRALGTTLAATAVSLAGVGGAEAGQVTIAVNYGGFAYCNVCGAADYTVPGLDSWNDGLSSFLDPVPAGATVVSMSASLQATGDGQADVSVNGTPLGTSVIAGSPGTCDTCSEGSAAMSATYDGGFPGYVTGGMQTMQLVSSSTGMALDSVSLTVAYRLCGDAVTDPGEACDTGAESATCNADCTPAACGDGHVNAAAGELCDVMGENAACDDDCTLAECGDGHVNAATGEACDDFNTSDGDGCSSACQIEDPSTTSAATTVSASSTSTGAGGAGGDEPATTVGPGPGSGGSGGDGGTASVGPTASGIAVVAAGGPTGGGGDDRGGSDGEGRDDADGGEGGQRADDAVGGGADGCGCTIPRRSRSPLGMVVWLALGAMAVRRRVVRPSETRS